MPRVANPGADSVEESNLAQGDRDPGADLQGDGAESIRYGRA